MTRNQRLAATRLALHDLVCMTGCEDDQAKDHARRTMHTKARQIVDDGTTEVLLDVIHELVHPTCTSSHRPKITAPQVVMIAAAAGIDPHP